MVLYKGSKFWQISEKRAFSQSPRKQKKIENIKITYF